MELGSGDGRVNFAAIDPPFEARQSVGMEVDASLIAACEERKGRRHPVPENLQFVEGDILEGELDLEGCTVLTMYFADEGLAKVKPILEEKLGGSGCRILSFGYAVKGWSPKYVEHILGLPIHFYVMDEELYSLALDDINAEEESDGKGDKNKGSGDDEEEDSSLSWANDDEEEEEDEDENQGLTVEEILKKKMDEIEAKKKSKKSWKF